MEKTNQDIYDRLGITNKEYLSAASKRALAWKRWSNEWFGEFEVSDLKGDLAYEEGIVRRDPSAMIKNNNLYYVWYSKSVGATDGFAGDLDQDKVFSLGSMRYLVCNLRRWLDLERARGRSGAWESRRI